jgi:hypothetical protein
VLSEVKVHCIEGQTTAGSGKRAGTLAVNKPTCGIGVVSVGCHVLIVQALRMRSQLEGFTGARDKHEMRVAKKYEVYSGRLSETNMLSLKSGATLPARSESP